YYRGHDAVGLAATKSVEEVASLIWTGRFDVPFASAEDTGLRVGLDQSLPFAARAQAMLATASVQDRLAFDLRAENVARRGWRILHLLAAAAIGERGARTPRRLSRGPVTVDDALARAWNVDAKGRELIRTSLILCADHELNV